MAIPHWEVIIIKTTSLFGKTEAESSSYEQGRQKAALLFLSQEPKKIIASKQFPHDETHVYSRLLDRTYRIDLDSGRSEYQENESWFYSDYYSAMILYDLIGYSDASCGAAYSYTALQNLSTVFNAHSYAGERMFDPVVRSIATAPDRFRNACMSLGGTEDSKGDISYVIPCLFYHGTLSVILRFYAEDEEFPPQLTVLFDKNTLQYMHYETAWYLAAHLLKRISDLAGF